MATILRPGLFQLKGLIEPREGRMAISLPGILFVTGNEVFSFDSNALQIQGKLSSIVCAWIDATGLTHGKSLYLTNGMERLVIPGGTQGYYAVTTAMPMNATISADAGAAGAITINLFNFSVTPGQSTIVQQVQGSLIVTSGTVTASQGGAPWSQNITEINGSPVSLGSALSAASLPVVIASDQTIGENWTKLDSKTFVYASYHLTGAGTTTPTSATAYVLVLTIVCLTIGGTLTIRSKEVTPKTLWTGTLAVGTNAVLNFNTPVQLLSGIDIIASAGVVLVDVFLTYVQ
jgi:hypothetical protein